MTVMARVVRATPHRSAGEAWGLIVDLLAPDGDLSLAQEVQRRALLALKGHFQLDNLLVFNRKFFPLWERRFVVYESRKDLPRVGIASLAAEAYLPFQGKRR